MTYMALKSRYTSSTNVLGIEMSIQANFDRGSYYSELPYCDT